MDMTSDYRLVLAIQGQNLNEKFKWDEPTSCDDNFSNHFAIVYYMNTNSLKWRFELNYDVVDRSVQQFEQTIKFRRILDLRLSDDKKELLVVVDAQRTSDQKTQNLLIWLIDVNKANPKVNQALTFTVDGFRLGGYDTGPAGHSMTMVQSGLKPHAFFALWPDKTSPSPKYQQAVVKVYVHGGQASNEYQYQTQYDASTFTILGGLQLSDFPCFSCAIEAFTDNEHVVVAGNTFYNENNANNPNEVIAVNFLAINDVNSISADEKVLIQETNPEDPFSLNIVKQAT